MLMSQRTSSHQNLVSIIPGPYSCLNAGCLPYAVEKQPSIPLINLGRTCLLNDGDDDDDDNVI